MASKHSSGTAASPRRRTAGDSDGANGAGGNGGNGQEGDRAAAVAAAAAPGASLAVDADPTPAVPKDFATTIYDAFKEAFGGNNDRQLLSLCWPGTILDYDRMAWEKEDEIAGNMPEASLIRSSLILDQYVPPAPLTQPDGTRVSDRYSQVLSQYGPRPNQSLMQLQEVIRERLGHEVVRDVYGEPTTMSLGGWFDYLYSQWTGAKRAWGDVQQEMQDQFRARYEDDPNPDVWWDAYLKWYGTSADSYVQDINSKWAQLVAEFPLTQWEDAITVLDTRDNVGILDARQVLANATRPVPPEEGVDYVPTQGVPYDWPLELKPVTKFLDRLADPEAQQQLYETALTQLEQEIFNWTAIMPQIEDDQIKASLRALSDKRAEFTSAQADLNKQYTANTVEAVRIYCDIQKARGKKVSDITGKETDLVKARVNDVASGLHDDNEQPWHEITDWDEIKAIAERIGEGQNTLWDKQQAMQDAGFELADAAALYLADKAHQSQHPWLHAYVEQLRSKLDAVRRQLDNHASSANVWAKYVHTTDGSLTPNESPDFAKSAYPSPLDLPADERWTEITMTLSQASIRAESKMNTWFSRSNWGVNFFFFSAGGSYEHSGATFANDFLEENSQVQIGCLATKVLIQRPWMRPDIFNYSSNMFRVTSQGYGPGTEMTPAHVTGADGANWIGRLRTEFELPCYPVAAILVKDVTIRMQIKKDRMSDMRKHAKMAGSSGGGFMCFSVSHTYQSESQSQSSSSYNMAGQFVARAAAPQIIGYVLQFMPPDNSVVLKAAEASQIARSLGFLRKLSDVHTSSLATPGAFR
jgi:hypothetical protein